MDAEVRPVTEVEYLDDYRTTYLVYTDDGGAHVVPEAALDRIADTGHMPEEMRPVLKRIIEEWKEIVND